MVAIGATAMYFAPLALRVPHYTTATLKNIYLDLLYLGLAGTIKSRMDLKPRRQNILWAVDCAWEGLRKIPIGPLQKAMDLEITKAIAVAGS